MSVIIDSACKTWSQFRSEGHAKQRCRLLYQIASTYDADQQLLAPDSWPQGDFVFRRANESGIDLTSPCDPNIVSYPNASFIEYRMPTAVASLNSDTLSAIPLHLQPVIIDYSCNRDLRLTFPTIAKKRLVGVRVDGTLFDINRHGNTSTPGYWNSQ